MLYPHHHWELDLVSLAEGKLPLPWTGSLITSDMWLLKLQRLGPSDLRSRHKAEVTGVNRAESGARRTGTGRLWEETSQPLEVPVTCKHYWGGRGNPTAPCTKGETETKSTLLVGLARESAVLSLLPAYLAPLDSVSPSVHEKQDYLPHFLGMIILITNNLNNRNNLHNKS